MTSPLVILVASSVVVGIVGSVFILLAISVDSWTEIDYDDSQLTQYNTNNTDDTIQVTPRTSRDAYIKYKYRASSTDAWKTYFLYYEYGGAWRLCDTLTGTYRVLDVTAGGSRVVEDILPKFKLMNITILVYTYILYIYDRNG